MKVQTKILLLLVALVLTLGGLLTLLKLSEMRKFDGIARARTVERDRIFDLFLNERGDGLKVLMEDSSAWDDMVRAVVKGDIGWVDQKFNDETLATYQVNAVWIYKPDGTLLFSRNNRYADTLTELPIPNEATRTLFERERSCHFFVDTSLGWMEIRGGTIHPSLDRFRETVPQGSIFVGRFWTAENIRRMALFTGYDLRIAPPNTKEPAPDDAGVIIFSRALPGWNGLPVATLLVRNDSPIIRELSRASDELFMHIVLFALVLVLVLWASLWFWVRRPLRTITRGLASGEVNALEPLQNRPHEFGQLARVILQQRRTEEALQETEEQLRHAQKMEAVGRLAGGVAHDFNNLLTAIIGYSELLGSKLVGQDGMLEHAQMIRKAGEQAAGLTRQLLAFSRKQLLSPKVFDLNALVRDMERLLQRVIGEHIRIQIDARVDDARVRADPGQLEQVVLNLGVNARDAMPRGGTLHISTSSHTEAVGNEDLPAGEYVVLSVRDTGAGMDAETMSRIFEPFFTTKGPGKGTGLGLSTVYGIVRQSGGTIRVTSTVGAGSEFRIYLPHTSEPIEAAAPERLITSGRGNSELILVAEDEQVVRDLMCAVLRDVGYEVICAATPHEAIQCSNDHPGQIDLLVTDVVMPEMHGPVLARALASSQPRMKVLYVSGYSENDISDQGVIEPNLNVLQKPFTHYVLVRKVQELLQREAVAGTDGNRLGL